MFSSNPFPQISSPIHVSHPLNPFFDLEKDGVHYPPPPPEVHNNNNNNNNNNNDPFLSSGESSFFRSYNGGFSPPPPPPPPPAHMVTDQYHYNHNNNNSICSNTYDQLESSAHEHLQLQDGSGMQYWDNYHDLLESVVYPSKKRAVVAAKKDGHSKIYTAQGPRDRRVRLSIDIARKFFVLQDLLGFDKASKTLDWLFTKSKKAIKELIEEVKNSSSSSVSTDQCEMAFLETMKGGSDEEEKGQKKSALKMTQKCKSGFHATAAKDQSRAEARARARERTKQKLRIKELENELIKKVPDDYYPSCHHHGLSPSNITLQSSSWAQCESQSNYNNDILRESTMEQRFSMSSSMLYTYNHNFVVSDEWISQISSKEL